MINAIKTMIYTFYLAYLSTALIPFCFYSWDNQQFFNNLSTMLFLLFYSLGLIFIFYSDYDIDLTNAVLGSSIIVLIGVICFITSGIIAASTFITFGYTCMYLRLIYNFIKFSTIEGTNK